MKNKIFSLVMCAVLLVCITGCQNEKKIAEKAVSYLENNNYKCNKGSKYEAVGKTYEGKLYICSSENVTTERTFVIEYGDEFRMYYIFEEKFSDETINYIINPIAFEYENVGRILLYKNNEELSMFEHNEYTDDEKQYVSVQSMCLADYTLEKYKNSERCEYGRAYQNLVNESIKEYKDVYKEIGLEMPIK